MSLLNTVQADIQQITTTDFATDLTFTPPGDDPVSVTVKGYASKHSLDVNQIGFTVVNSKKCYCGVSEKTLTNAGYTTRDSDGNLITFEKHLVAWTDVSGQSKTYIIQAGQSKPNETVGYIVFILGYFKPATP